VDALISTEDARFREHCGVDFRALMRVLFRTVLGGDESSGGGSTISQQLSKLLFHKRPQSKIETIKQKIKEWVIAVKLEKAYTKEEIISMYLNKVDFLNLAVGINSASQVYFNSSPSELKIEQAATLVGMLKNPSLYNPLRRLELTKNRRNVVFAQMKRYGKITEQELDSLKQFPLTIDFQRVDHKLGMAPYFREWLRQIISRNKPNKEKYKNKNSYRKALYKWENDPIYGWCNKNFKSEDEPYNIYSDGLRIYTSIDSRMQEMAEQCLKDHIETYVQHKFDSLQTWNRYKPYSSELEAKQYYNLLHFAIKTTERYRLLKRKGMSKDSIIKTFCKPIQTSVFTWKGEVDTLLSPLDSLKHMKKFFHAGMMSFEPKTGHVKAYVGGINYKHFQYDHVIEQRRQVGSTFKPFLYTLAMQEGMSPCHTFANVPTTFYMADTTWTPDNSGSERLGEMVSLAWGLKKSNNYISAKLMMQFKPQPVVQLANKLGVKSYIPAVPSICLGVAELTLYELVGAYGAFPNKGIFTKPIFITRIEDKYGNIIAKFIPDQHDAISEETAYLMVNLLENVTSGSNETGWGTAAGLRGSKYQLHNQIAGKTGTTNDHADGWFVGFTPDLVTGIWVGADERNIHFKNITYGQGARMAMPIWGNYMNKIYNDSLELGYLKSSEFEKPESVPYWKVDCKEYELKNNQNFETTSPDEIEGGMY
jgi:penicillin-binding protein 1A